MPFEAIFTSYFEKSLKAFLKNYPKSKPDIESLIETIEQKPAIGDSIPGYSNLLYKIRWGLKSYRIGKKGGIRLIYFFNNEKLYLIFIYSKKKRENHPDILLKDWLNESGFGVK